MLTRSVYSISVAAASLLMPGAPAAAAEELARYERFDSGEFESSSTIDNSWMPLRAGTKFVFEGTTVDDGETLPHRVEIHVTDLRKVIDGVCSVVSWDLDYSEGELVEAELAFFAQDRHGNVWRMGEHPEEYEDGKLIDAPTWISGIDEARAGISMKAQPEPGTSYSQGWAPKVGFTDRGQVIEMGQRTTVATGNYEDVLVVAETSDAEPGAAQLKYFARGVGNVRVGWRGEGEKTREVLELVEVAQLDSSGLAEVRAKALELEKSAYRISESYARTPPMQVGCERMLSETGDGPRFD